MVRFRRRLLIAVLLVAAIAGFLKLALVTTATNPTGRYFSSQILAETGTSESGYVAEKMLAADLRLTRNDSNAGERLCFCAEHIETPPPNCNQCTVTTPAIANWRIPDFVTDERIIDSKAVGRFTIDNQIRDFIAVAQETERELWIFVRLDTEVSPNVRETIRATGGDVVAYFIVADYVGRWIVEQALHNVLLVAIILALGLFVWDYMARQKPQKPQEPDPPQSAKRAEESTEDTEEYMRRMERLSKRTLHDDESQDK